ncbi:MAG: YgiT-type zinc finger protein [Vicinamibacterales bacterium]
MTSSGIATPAGRCVMCPDGRCVDGFTTITLERDEATIVFRRVPARVCDVCGAEDIGIDIAGELEQLANAAIAAGVKHEVRDYVAASLAAAKGARE